VKTHWAPFCSTEIQRGNFMRSVSIFSFFVFLSFIISNSVEARGFGRRASDFKGFNPCGWNSCQGGGVRRVGPIRRLFGGGRRMSSGGCGGGSCGPRQGEGCGGGSCGAGPARAGAAGAGLSGLGEEKLVVARRPRASAAQMSGVPYLIL
jgi:hypothetical protein